MDSKPKELGGGGIDPATDTWDRERDKCGVAVNHLGGLRIVHDASGRLERIEPLASADAEDRIGGNGMIEFVKHARRDQQKKQENDR